LTQNIPFIALQPPSTRPRGCAIRLPAQPGSGSVSNAQSNDVPYCMGASSGARIVNRRSEPPASTKSTLAEDSVANRPATAHPAEPAPTTM
jgi:hypothetical protein